MGMCHHFTGRTVHRVSQVGLPPVLPPVPPAPCSAAPSLPSSLTSCTLLPAPGAMTTGRHVCMSLGGAPPMASVATAATATRSAAQTTAQHAPSTPPQPRSCRRFARSWQPMSALAEECAAQRSSWTSCRSRWARHWLDCTVEGSTRGSSAAGTAGAAAAHEPRAGLIG